MDWLCLVEIDSQEGGGIYNAKRGIQLKGNEWHDIFQKATFNIKIKSSILKTGVMD
jgi:hypothetical protein